ncbi:PREDICTED: putative deoxyribonuclease TATDN1 [Nicrophorus vespilloides]|uniref:Deoxyribonuclease TATDN1 n=1 Tax=Nicrophorus vespilloides TaxID=110193 RepID=A0ABM1MWJ0_NICVS|nr:PREDICTED: putative deoxyribonuclease TATDN1 [Nicrophorus vespilloides]
MLKMKKYIDIGANLTDLMYSGIYNGSKKHQEDLSHVLKRSWDAGLSKIIITGGNVEESNKAVEVAKSDERLFCTVGCHPTRCMEFESNPDTYLNELKTIAEGNHKVVAIGECGLDYDRIQFCPKDIQKKYFELQLKLSKDLKLPLFLHCRNAANDLYEILSKHQLNGGVVHSFDGTFEEAQKFIDLGYYIGLNGCSLKTKENLETVEQLPINKIMIETDCPWCEIRPSHAGYQLIPKDSQMVSVKKEKWREDAMVKSRNEPANITQVLNVIAAVKKVDSQELADQILENTNKLFFK